MSIAGTLSLLASLKPDARGVRNRAGESLESSAARRPARDGGGRTFSTDTAETGSEKNYWLWLDIAMTGLWVALLLSIVAYAVVEGEAALAQLDGLDLVAAHSTAP